MVVRLVVQTLGWCAFLALLLLWPAGSAAWWPAWAFIGLIAVLGISVGLWLVRNDPDLLKERLAPPVQADQKPWDRVFMGLVFIGFHVWLALMALDGGRLHWSPTPLWAKALGAALIVLCFWGVTFVFRANSFAAPVVKLQEERGQHVADTGPYAYVRHPMYAGATLFFIGAPLLLGSLWGLALLPLMLGLFAYRAMGEERMLMSDLPGYADYASRVRFRLLPGVW